MTEFYLRILKAPGQKEIFRSVGDFVVLLDWDSQRFDEEISGVLATFSECLESLILTHELSVNGSSIRFLDLRLHCHSSHMCWLYEPGGNKPLLLFPF